jgi:hypothetical protein
MNAVLREVARKLPYRWRMWLRGSALNLLFDVAHWIP